MLSRLVKRFEDVAKILQSLVSVEIFQSHTHMRTHAQKLAHNCKQKCTTIHTYAHMERKYYCLKISLAIALTAIDWKHSFLAFSFCNSIFKLNYVVEAVLPRSPIHVTRSTF